MKIELNDKYQITGDKHNLILQEKKYPNTNHHMTVNTNDFRWIDLGYYGKLSHLVNALIHNEIKQSEAERLEDIIWLINKVEKSITEKIEGAAK